MGSISHEISQKSLLSVRCVTTYATMIAGSNPATSGMNVFFGLGDTFFGYLPVEGNILAGTEETSSSNRKKFSSNRETS